MSRYSTKDKVFAIEAYYRSDGNVHFALKKWTIKHKNRPKPSFQTVIDLVAKFKRTGSVNYDTEVLYQNGRKRPPTPRNHRLYGVRVGMLVLAVDNQFRTPLAPQITGLVVEPRLVEIPN